MDGLTDDVKAAYTWITQLLHSQNIEYVVIGGLAAYLYGSHRPIADIDIGIKSPHLKTIKRFIQVHIHEDYSNGYADELWELELFVLKYNTTVIDLFHRDTLRFFNNKLNHWDTINTDKISYIDKYGLKYQLFQ